MIKKNSVSFILCFLSILSPVRSRSCRVKKVMQRCRTVSNSSWVCR